MIYYDAEICPQGSPFWWELRKGIPTASSFDEIMTPAKCLPSIQADAYGRRLCQDLLEPNPHWLTEGMTRPPSRVTSAMERGQEIEPTARRFYAAATENRVRLAGFCLTDDRKWGCSPDGLIVDGLGEFQGGLELKCPMPHTQDLYLAKGELPLAYKCQVHGNLLVTGLPWWDFLSFCPDKEPLLIRVEPDDFTVKLAETLEAWFPRYLEIRKKILGPMPAPAA